MSATGGCKIRGSEWLSEDAPESRKIRRNLSPHVNMEMDPSPLTHTGSEIELSINNPRTADTNGSKVYVSMRNVMLGLGSFAVQSAIGIV